MNSLPTNPFLLSGYISPEYFCDRISETERLRAAFENGRSVTLISPRRMGKTGLLRHLFHHIMQEKNAHCFYVDLYQTGTLAELVKKLADTVLGKLDAPSMSVAQRVMAFFKSLRPTLTVDPETQQLSFSVTVEESQAEHSLQEILSYMEQSDKPCCIAFDEFQSIAYYEQKNIEALLRAHFQHLTNVRFIFSGSQRHVLEQMFVSAKRPFYQSTQMMTLEVIEEAAYLAFAQEHLQANKQCISATAFHHLYNKLHGHTWYVQMVLNRIYESRQAEVDEQLIDCTINSLLNENEATYQTLLRIVSPMQRKTLTAVAREGIAKEVYSKTFTNRHRLGAVSSVQVSIQALVDKELLLDDGKCYSVYDRFFSLWLAKG